MLRIRPIWKPLDVERFTCGFRQLVTDKTQKDELTVGQRVAIEINRAEAEGLFERGKQAQIEAGKYGKLGGRGNKHKTPVRTRAQGFQKTRDIIAARAGVSYYTVQKLLAIKHRCPDLFQRIFDGWYDEKGREVTINAVYRMMKLEEKRWARHGLERRKSGFKG